MLDLVKQVVLTSLENALHSVIDLCLSRWNSFGFFSIIYDIVINFLIILGGYALVFSAQDTQGNWFALKRQLAADSEAAEAVLKEIRFLREVTSFRFYCTIWFVIYYFCLLDCFCSSILFSNQK